MRANLNAVFNNMCKVTLKRKSQGQGHREKSQFRRSCHHLFPCKVAKSVLIHLTKNKLKRRGYQNVDRLTNRQTDGQTDIINP